MTVVGSQIELYKSNLHI